MTNNRKNNVKPTIVRRLGRLLIILVLLITVAAGAYFVYRLTQNKKDAGPEQLNQDRPVPVVTTPVAVRDFERTLVLQGNIEAKNFALVSPRIPGTIDDIFVEEGDVVKAKETRLFQTDAANLKENVEIGRHNLTVAKFARQQAEASLEKTRADLHKANLDYQRFKRLLQKEAVTPDAFERQESRYLQLKAAEKLAQTQVKLSEAQQDQAEAALEIAKKNLSDATIYAPVTGKVSRRLREPGEMGAPGQPVLRIDDTSLIEVAAFLPAPYHSSIIIDKTMMKIQVGDVNLGRNTITYKSPTIEPRLRTFEVKSLLKEPPGSVVPGAMAQIVVVLEQRRAPGVPSAAIQQRGGRYVVFVVKDNIAHQVPVEPGIEMDEWTEIRKGRVDEEEDVVTMGQYMIEEGTKVVVQKEEQ